MTEATIVTIGAVVLTITALIVGFVIGYDTAYEEMDRKRGNMDVDEIVRALRCVQEKHRNDCLLTFQTDVSAMARDAADMIESLQAQLNDVVPVVAWGVDLRNKRIFPHMFRLQNLAGAFGG